MLYSNLSAAYLQLDRKQDALQAAHSAVEIAPRGFHMVSRKSQSPEQILRDTEPVAKLTLPYSSVVEVIFTMPLLLLCVHMHMLYNMHTECCLDHSVYAQADILCCVKHPFSASSVI